MIQIGLGEHVNERMSAGGLFFHGPIEIMVARVDMNKAKLMVTLMVTTPDYFLVEYRDSFSLEE
ncbi:MAG: hypothetical protein COB30_002345 [Ectothiorhodospiraceae bacterium]|nr:hypothetical protein [Ectothiorhodospiraceae bacterium]